MVQRAGRIDRLGSDFDTLWIYNMFPDEGLERLLGLVESLSRKIASIDQLGMLDASAYWAKPFIHRISTPSGVYTMRMGV